VRFIQYILVCAIRVRCVQWARSLHKAIVQTFYVELGEDRGMYAITKGPFDDPSVLRHYGTPPVPVLPVHSMITRAHTL
jgi:hypothetical protein